MSYKCTYEASFANPNRGHRRPVKFTCTCGDCIMTRLPCIHVVALFLQYARITNTSYNRADLANLAPDEWLYDNWLKLYEHGFDVPVRSEILQEPDIRDDTMRRVQVFRPKVGRPKKNSRHKSWKETGRKRHISPMTFRARSKRIRNQL